MCQSKAEGGRRCAHHLEQGASAAVVTYVATVTGLNSKETGQVYESLMDEGRTLAAPTRQEVDALLEQQIFRARHEEGITEKRRESIIRRLRDALGNILPSGATFHAWRNILSEAWTSVRRKAAAAFVAGALTFSLGACGTTGTPVESPTQAERVAAAAADPSPAARNFDTSWEVPAYTPSKSAVALFGEDGAREGADTAIEHLVTVSLNEELGAADTDAATKQQVLLFTKDMTPDTAKSYSGIVKGYFGKGADAKQEHQADMFSFVAVSALGTEHNPAEGPIFSEQEVKTIAVDTDSTGRLVVTVKVSGKLRGFFDGENQIAKFERDQSFWMEKTPNDGWKFDGWSGDMRVSTPKAEK